MAVDMERTGREFYGCPEMKKEWGRPFVSQERQFREDASVVGRNAAKSATRGRGREGKC